MAARGVCYHFISAESVDDWVTQDTICDLPRAFGICVSLGLTRHYFSFAKIGFNRIGIIPAIIYLVFLCIWQWAQSFVLSPFHVSSHQLLILSLSSVLVGANEELLFRGNLMTALRARWNDHVAVWASSLLFVPFHIGAQAPHVFPRIFLFALSFGYLRAAGVSLWYLFAVHAIFDSFVFLTAAFDNVPIWFYVLDLCVQGIAFVSILKFTPKAPRDTVLATD